MGNRLGKRRGAHSRVTVLCKHSLNDRHAMPSEETKVRRTTVIKLCSSSNNIIAGENHQGGRPCKGASGLRRLLTFRPHTLWCALQTVVHYGWIPFIIYVGYTRSNPQPSLIKCVSVVEAAKLIR